MKLSQLLQRTAAVTMVIGLLASCGGGGPDGPAETGAAPAQSAPTAQSAQSAQTGVVTAMRSSALPADCPSGGVTVEAGLDRNGNGLLDADEERSAQHSCRGDNDHDRNLTTLVAVRAEPAGRNCPAGGYKVMVGPDSNRNGVLDAAEVKSTVYVCHGTNGRNGTNGTNGLNSLVSIINEPAAAACASGGFKMTSGLDRNGNDVLDSNEVITTSFVCHGSSGSNGSNGLNSLVSIVTEPAGGNCANGGSRMTSGLDRNANNMLDADEVGTTTYVCNGVDGRNGTDGLTTLMSIVSEPAGANCTYGGSQTTSGLDSNRNHILEAGEVTATAYVCNGAPGSTGSGFAWRHVTASSVQAEPNTGYLVDNAGRVTVTLPASLNVGDVVKVSGVGSGGWKIAQNEGQSIVTRNFGGGFDGAWTARERNDNRYWSSVASSADGIRLVAVEANGQIYTSTDSGVSWTARELNRRWSSVASSADGTRLAAVVRFGQIHTSTDSGVSWTARESTRYWASVASSADGTRLVAVVAGGQIYTSTDSGVSWTARESNRTWFSLASSASGTRLVALDGGGDIYISTDLGVTWTAQGLSVRRWSSVASSSDGTRLVASVDNGQLYSFVGATLPGNAGSISGQQYDAIELQYIGNGQFNVLSHAGSLVVQ